MNIFIKIINWMRLHKVWTGIIAFVAFFIIVGVIDQKPETTAPTQSSNAQTAPTSTPSQTTQQVVKKVEVKKS